MPDRFLAIYLPKSFNKLGGRVSMSIFVHENIKKLFIII